MKFHGEGRAGSLEMAKNAFVWTILKIHWLHENLSLVPMDFELMNLSLQGSKNLQANTQTHLWFT